MGTVQIHANHPPAHQGQDFRYRVRRFFVRSRGDSPAKRMLIHLLLIIACFMAVYPVLRVFTISIRPGNRILSTDLSIIPEGATFETYVNVFRDTDFVLWIWNSLAITIATATIGVTIASTSAYAFSRWSFPGKTVGMIALLATQMIPGAMLMVPLYILAVRLGLINSWRGIAIAYSVSSVPFSIWILKGYYDTIPFELEQAAMIDGSSRLGAFYRIILPLAAPALAIAFLFNFTQAWNEFVLARIMLQNPDLATWPLGLNRMIIQFQTQWDEFSAASVMISIPVMALFLLSSKWLISGLTLGSVKG
jgi:arabinogalactan oligomer / maltooligosaccharide transport system permease protein